MKGRKKSVMQHGKQLVSRKLRELEALERKQKKLPQELAQTRRRLANAVSLYEHVEKRFDEEQRQVRWITGELEHYIKEYKAAKGSADYYKIQYDACARLKRVQEDRLQAAKLWNSRLVVIVAVQAALAAGFALQLYVQL